MAVAGQEPTGIAARLEGYEGICSLATGGMAEVCLARTVGPAPRLVVIKSLPEAFRFDADRLDMFMDEIRIGRMLQHPNVVRLLEGSYLGHEPYMVLEYVDGPSFRELGDACCEAETPMDPQMAVTLAVGICDGLQYAHLARRPEGGPIGLVHRDVSPRNLMVTRAGVAKLLDFGIARAEGRRHRTAGRRVKGKIAYAAPEYIKGATPDHRADIFALGVVLWELLTNRRLFHGSNMAETVLAVLKNPVPLPSAYNSDVPPELDQAVSVALRRDVDTRWASASALRDALFAAAHCLGGVLAPEAIASRLLSDFPALLDDERSLKPELSAGELTTRAVRLGRSSSSHTPVSRPGPVDTAVEVDVTLDDLSDYEGETVSKIEIPPWIFDEE